MTEQLFPPRSAPPCWATKLRWKSPISSSKTHPCCGWACTWSSTTRATESPTIYNAILTEVSKSIGFSLPIGRNEIRRRRRSRFRRVRFNCWGCVSQWLFSCCCGSCLSGDSEFDLNFRSLRFSQVVDHHCSLFVGESALKQGTPDRYSNLDELYRNR